MSEIIDGWNERPVNKIILSPGSRAWLHTLGITNGHIPGISYSCTVNSSAPVNINNGEIEDEINVNISGLILPSEEEEQVYGPGCIE